MDFDLEWNDDTCYEDQVFFNEDSFTKNSVTFWMQMKQLHIQCCEVIGVEPEECFKDEKVTKEKEHNEVIFKKEEQKKLNCPGRKNIHTLLPADHLPRFSRLTSEQHKFYLRLLHEYSGKVIEKKSNRQKKEIKTLADLHSVVVKEQEEYIKHLQYASRVRKKDYLQIHPNVHRYVKELLSEKLQHCMSYPKYYVLHKTLPIYKPGSLVKHTPILRHMATLLELGKLPSLVQPNLDMPCFIPLDYEKICKRFSPQKRSHKMKLPIHPSKEPVSQDFISKSLAEKHQVDFVMSLSSLKALLDCQPNESKSWELPIHVTECENENGDGLDATFKQVFIDKPLPPASMTIRQKNALYHKYAMKLKLTHFSQNTLKRSMAVLEGSDVCVENNTIVPEKTEVSRTLQKVGDNPFEEYTDDLWDKETFGTSSNNVKTLVSQNQIDELLSKNASIQDSQNEVKFKTKLLVRSENVDEDKEINGKEYTEQLPGKSDKKNTATCHAEQKTDISDSKHDHSTSSAEDMNKSISEKGSPKMEIINSENNSNRFKIPGEDMRVNSTEDKGQVISPNSGKHFSDNLSSEYCNDNYDSKVQSEGVVPLMVKRKRGRPPKRGRLCKAISPDGQRDQQLKESCANSSAEISQPGVSKEVITKKLVTDRVTRSKSRLLHSSSSQFSRPVRRSRKHFGNMGSRTTTSCDEDKSFSHSSDFSGSDEENIPLSPFTKRHRIKRIIASSDSSEEIPLLKNENTLADNKNESNNDDDPSLSPEKLNSSVESTVTNQGSKPSDDALSDDNLIIDEEIRQAGEISSKSSCSVLNGEKLITSNEQINSSDQGSKVKKPDVPPVKDKSGKKSVKSDIGGKGEVASMLDKILHSQEVMLSTKGISCAPSKTCPSTSPSSGVQHLSSNHQVPVEVSKKQNSSSSFVKSHSGGPNATATGRDERSQYPPIPPIDNVAYNLWNFEGWKLLLRSKVDCQMPPKNNSWFLFSKLEYQAQYGAEITTPSELLRLWTTLTFHPGTQALKVRIDALTSELLMMEEVFLSHLTAASAKFQPDHAVMQLNTILETLKKLPVGHYLLINKGDENTLSLHSATESGKRGPFILHAAINQRLSALDAPLSWNDQRIPPWLPVDPEVSLPLFKKHNRIPATFPPLHKKRHHHEGSTHKKKKELKEP